MQCWLSSLVETRVNDSKNSKTSNSSPLLYSFRIKFGSFMSIITLLGSSHLILWLMACRERDWHRLKSPKHVCCWRAVIFYVKIDSRRDISTKNSGTRTRFLYWGVIHRCEARSKLFSTIVIKWRYSWMKMLITSVGCLKGLISDLYRALLYIITSIKEAKPKMRHRRCAFRFGGAENAGVGRKFR